MSFLYDKIFWNALLIRNDQYTLLYRCDYYCLSSVTKVNSLDICNVVQKRLIMVLCRGTKKLSQMNKLQCQLCKRMWENVTKMAYCNLSMAILRNP